MMDVTKIYYNSHTLDVVDNINKITKAFPHVRTYQKAISDKYNIYTTTGSVIKGKEAVNIIKNVTAITDKSVDITTSEIQYIPSDISVNDKLIIITCVYNAEKYIKRCIDSIKQQTEDFICYITDDKSTDNTVNIINTEIENDSRFIFIQNETRIYQLESQYNISKHEHLHNESIIIILDGDDWFYDSNVLTRVKIYYSNPRILMHFGQFITYNNGLKNKGFTKRPNNIRNVRTLPWSTSHMRTYKLGLFRQIRKCDLISPRGNFWECAADLASIYPMIEMCADDRIGFTNDLNVVYNLENSNNVHKSKIASLQSLNAKAIKSMNRYPLKYK